PGRGSGDAPAGEDGGAAHERARDPAAQRAAGPGAVGMAVQPRLRAARALPAEVHEGEVGVRARLDPALPGQAEAPGGAPGAEGRDLLEGEPASVMAGVEHDPEQRWAAGDPAPDREEVVALLELGQRRRMVARDEGDVADR